MKLKEKALMKAFYTFMNRCNTSTSAFGHLDKYLQMGIYSVVISVFSFSFIVHGNVYLTVIYVLNHVPYRYWYDNNYSSIHL